MASGRSRGFTLIELLTVVAIIAILAALTAIAVPQVLERARMRSTENNMNQMATALAQYFADQGSYPPGYGYRRFAPLNTPGLSDDERNFWIQPWNAILRLYNNSDVMDPYANSYDTNQNGAIEALEYSPIPQQLGPQQFAYPTAIFNPFASPAGEIATNIARQLQESTRPFVYIPVNLNDFRKVQAYYNNALAGDFADRQNASVWDASSPALQSVMTSTPARYDAFVLISVGPNVHTAGVLPDPLPASGNFNPFYMAGLRAYFLATRDANNNGAKDFDYRSRTSGGPDSSPDAYRETYPAIADRLILMPDGSGRPGPLIYSRQ